MARIFFSFGISFAATSMLCAHAAPRLNPPMPAISEFAECKPIRDEKFPHWDVYQCLRPSPYSEIGKPVDGNSFMRHGRWTLFKYSRFSYEIDTITQIAYDCRTRRLVTRAVYLSTTEKDLAPEKHQMRLKDWEDFMTPDPLDWMNEYCPAKSGHVHINAFDVDVASAMRRGSRINAAVEFGNGKKAVVTVDCNLMTWGIDSQPTKPIGPKTTGSRMYKLLCSR